MSYISNRIVNRLNIHSVLHTAGFNLAGNFFIIFLLSHHFSAVSFFLYLPLILMLRFALRPIVLYIAPRIGSRRTLYIGVCFFAAQYISLAWVDGIDGAFALYCLLCALADIFYWTPYHSIFSFLADDAHRGKQISAREALNTIATVLAPLAGGLAIDYFGAKAAFSIGAVIELCSIIPLLCIPNIPIAHKRPHGAFNAVREGACIFITDGWIAISFLYAWAVMLFNSTGSHYTKFGGAFALAGLVASLAGLLIGKMIDAGHAQRTVIIGGLFCIGAIILKASAGGDLTEKMGIMSICSLLAISYNPMLMTAIYRLAAKAPCTLRFIFVTEGSWDIGSTSCCLAIAGLLSCGAPIGWAVAMAIPVTLLQMVLLYKFYKQSMPARLVDLPQ